MKQTLQVRLRQHLARQRRHLRFQARGGFARFGVAPG
jgi:hypothetical protein